MLVQTSTIFSHAKRSFQPIIALNAYNLEIALAGVRAAESQKRNLILSIDATKPLQSSLSTLVVAYSLIAEESTQKVSVEVITGAHHQAVEQAAEVGAITVCLKPHQESWEQVIALFSWASKNFQAKQIVYGLSLTEAYVQPPDFEASWLENRQAFDPVQYVHFPVFRPIQDNHGLTPEHLSKMLKLFQKPVIASESDYNLAELRRFAHLGISGVELDQLIEKAYLAGIRTALHNRHLRQIEPVMKKGQQSVQNQIENIYQALSV